MVSNISNERLYDNYMFGSLTRLRFNPDYHIYFGRYGTATYIPKTDGYYGTRGWKGRNVLEKEFNIKITDEEYHKFITKRTMFWYQRKKKSRVAFVNKNKSKMVNIKLGVS